VDYNKLNDEKSKLEIELEKTKSLLEEDKNKRNQREDTNGEEIEKIKER
jgi:hypothetical protein